MIKSKLEQKVRSKIPLTQAEVETLDKLQFQETKEFALSDFYSYKEWLAYKKIKAQKLSFL